MPLNLKMVKQPNNRIFDPVITKNEDYVGNIKANSKSIEYKQLNKFLNQYFENYIITIESKDTDKEHCHFWASKCKLKPNDNNRTTLANYFRRDLPSLKRDGKGGKNKYNLKIMKEDFQFYYILKEQTKQTLKDIKTIGVTINEHDITNALDLYQKQLKAKKGGKAGEFYLYCVNKFGANSYALQQRSCLIETYMDWCAEFYTCPTINLCDRYVNGVLLQHSPEKLTQNFKDILNNKYNKEYF